MSILFKLWICVELLAEGNNRFFAWPEEKVIEPLEKELIEINILFL